MAAVSPARGLIVTADDFGRSHSINQAVVEAHQRGILTGASLMVAGEAFEEAVLLARENPRLGVGLHLTLCCGTSVLEACQIPSLVNSRQEFRSSPVAAGLKYFFSARARMELIHEVSFQFAKFIRTGLKLDHVNGHLHFHLHPAVFDGYSSRWAEFRIRAVRLTRTSLRIDWPLGRGRYFYRLSHAVIFNLLSLRIRSILRASKIAFVNQVFGLLENDRVTEEFLQKLLPRLPAGNSEVYSHPSLEGSRHELEALISPQVRETIQREGIQLIRYQDL